MIPCACMGEFRSAESNLLPCHISWDWTVVERKLPPLLLTRPEPRRDGDKGSAFYIGRWALYRTLRNLRQGNELSEFATRLLSAIHGEDADDLIEWTYRDFNLSKIAELAMHVCAWADEGLETAKRHVNGAADSLHEYVVRVSGRLG